MHCQKVTRILQYHMPNKLLYPEKFTHHVMLLFFKYRDEKQFLSGCPPLYQNNLREQLVPDFENGNKINLNHMVTYLIKLFLNLMTTQLAMKTHIAKLKMMKHLGQNVPMKMIQKIQKQTKLLPFLTLCHKYYQMMKSKKA